MAGKTSLGSFQGYEKIPLTKGSHGSRSVVEKSLLQSDETRLDFVFRRRKRHEALDWFQQWGRSRSFVLLKLNMESGNCEMYEHVELTQGLYVPFQETSGDSNTWKIVLVLIFHIEQWLQKRTAGRIHLTPQDFEKNGFGLGCQRYLSSICLRQG